MKKSLLIVVVAVLALTLAPLALAGGSGGGRKHGHAKFNLVGVVIAVNVADTAVDPAAVSSITLKVKAGSRTIRELRRKDAATFVVTADAPVWLLTRHGRVASMLGDIAAGDRVKARGTIAGASRVYTIRSLKFRDLTPETRPGETAPLPVTP